MVFARFLLPQIFFYGLFSILGQVLNARNKFGAMMWTPVLNNVVLISMFGVYLGMMTVPDSVQGITQTQVTLLGAGTTLALAIQAFALIPFARAAGFRFRPRFDWRGTGLGKSISAARWTLLFVLTNLVASTVVTRYASAADTALPNGGVGFSAYTYAQTIWSLPHSVITVSLVTALLPRMSRAVAEDRLDDMRTDLSRALRISGVVIVPAAVFFVALGPQMAQVVFAHGAADPASIVPLGEMLQAFGLGLIPFSAQYMLLRGFYAFEDTRTPFWMAVWISAGNIALATACHLLMPPALGSHRPGGRLCPPHHRAAAATTPRRPTGRQEAVPHLRQADGFRPRSRDPGLARGPHVRHHRHILHMGTYFGPGCGRRHDAHSLRALARILKVSELRSLPGLG